MPEYDKDLDNQLKNNKNIVQKKANSELNSEMLSTNNQVIEPKKDETILDSTEEVELENSENDLDNENPISESTLIELEDTTQKENLQNSKTDMGGKSEFEEPNSIQDFLNESFFVSSECGENSDIMSKTSDCVSTEERNKNDKINIENISSENPILESTTVEEKFDIENEKLQNNENSQNDVEQSSSIGESKNIEDFLNESFVVISECGESQETEDTAEENEDLGFVIDINPIEEKKTSNYVPFFRRSRKNILKEQEVKQEEKNDANPNKIKNTCFNCDGDHALKDCELPRNMKKINKARKLRNAKTERYHVDVEQRFAHIKPGKISHELTNALGLRNNEIPPMFYKMRVMGYPPAWLEATKIAHSGITLFGSKGFSVLGSDDDEGELEESKLKYDVTKIISFPGFNTDPGKGYFDDYKYQGVPPFSSKDSKSLFIKSFHSKTTKPGYKRRKLNIDVDNDNEKSFSFEDNVADMEVDDDEIGHTSQNMQLPLYLQNQPPPPPENPPLTPPPPPPEEGEIECGEESKLTDEGFQDLSLDDLQSKKAKLLKLLNCSEDKSENTTTEEIIIQTPAENDKVIISKNEENADNKNLSINENVVENESLPDDNNTPTETEIEIGLLKSSTIGTPLLKFSPYEKLPPGESFKDGVSDVINFENLPDSTGKYDQMRKLLFKVRKKINDINQSQDD